MLVCVNLRDPGSKARQAILIATLLVATLAGCGEEDLGEAPVVRPVRTVTVEKREAATAITLTGRIEFSDEAALGFRIGGRMIERQANVGDRVKAGQTLARLEPQNEMNALRADQANLVAAQARLAPANAARPRLDHARQF